MWGRSTIKSQKCSENIGGTLGKFSDFELYLSLSQLDFPETGYYGTFQGIPRRVMAHACPKICYTALEMLLDLCITL